MTEQLSLLPAGPPATPAPPNPPEQETPGPAPLTLTRTTTIEPTAPEISELTDEQLGALYRDYLAANDPRISAYPSPTTLQQYAGLAKRALTGEKIGPDPPQEFARFARLRFAAQREGLDLNTAISAFKTGKDVPTRPPALPAAATAPSTPDPLPPDPHEVDALDDDEDSASLGFKRMLLNDPTPELLKEIEDDETFIDLRYWPDGNLDAPLDAFDDPARAGDLLYTLKHRHVDEAKIRAALQKNWKAHGAETANHIRNEVDAGYYRHQLRSLLDNVTPAFVEPPDATAYWRRASYIRSSPLEDIERLIDMVTREWGRYHLYLQALNRLAEPPPPWIDELRRLLPALEAFEARFPRPSTPDTKRKTQNARGRKKGATAPPRRFLISQGVAAHWADATDPAAAITAAREGGLAHTGAWFIVRELCPGTLGGDAVELHAVAIVPASD